MNTFSRVASARFDRSGTPTFAASSLATPTRQRTRQVYVAQDLPDACAMANRCSLLISDAAVLLGVSRRTVYYRIRSGRLETIRTKGGTQRVLLESLERLLRSEQLARAGQGVSPEDSASAQRP